MKSKTSDRDISLRTELGSIFIFALAIFTLTALFTYSPSDPSFFTRSVQVSHNACGKVGAYIASIFLECFGIAAFILPAALFFLSAIIYKKEGSQRLSMTLGGMIVAVLSLTVFLSLQWKYWPFAGNLVLTGGIFGVWFSDILLRQFNPLGSSFVALLVFCAALVISTPVSVARMGARILNTAFTFLRAAVIRTAKIGFTYLLYLFGVVAAKTAHAFGNLIQKTLDYGLDWAKSKSTKKPAPSQVAEPITRLEKVVPVVSENLFGKEVPNALPELEPKQTEAQKIATGEMKTPAILSPEIQQSLELVPTIGLAAGEEKPATENKASLNSPASRISEKLAKAAARVSKRGQWKLPSVEFLRKPPKIESSIDRDRLIQNSHILKQKFSDFGIDGEVTAVRPGPVITLYEFKPGPGVKVSRIAALADDLSMALSAQSVRILAPLPGKAVVGIEIPSESRETVFLREFLQHPDFHGSKHMIPVVMGKDIGGQTYLSDLGRMPHLLCAGQTGSGKSVFMNGLICSLLYRFTPDELRLILVDPKFIEFRAYQDIPHLLLPVVDDPKHASTALKWAVREMERRYRILAMLGARNLASFNQKVEEMGAEVVHDLLFSEETQPEGLEKMSGGDWVEAFEPDETGAPRIGKLPYIVVIIDELADLMMIAKKEVEISIARIAQKARAAGIHLVIATQRPSTDVVTGLIKANLPSRASFQLASYIDSKTILDRSGAERLLGHGDMLFIPPGVSQLLRLHGAYVDDDEIHKITSFLKSQGKPAYKDEILVDEESEDDADGDDIEDADALFNDAVELVKRSGHASASFLQRHLKVGYNRAARMIETMEHRGIVGPADGARPREVLMR